MAGGTPEHAPLKRMLSHEKMRTQQMCCMHMHPMRNHICYHTLMLDTRAHIGHGVAMVHALTLALILAVAPVLGMLALDAYVMGVMIAHVYDGELMHAYEEICTSRP